MVVVLADHIAERAAAHLFEDLAAYSGAAPLDLFPDEDSEAVAEVEDAARLLVVREADEVDASILDELHLLVDQVVGHGGGISSVVFVAVGSAEQQALAVEFEGAVLDPLGVSQSRTSRVRCSRLLCYGWIRCTRRGGVLWDSTVGVWG